ncbi:hypothetical protein ACWGBV_11070 [Streptomyces sp. NPDC055051]
MSGQIIFTDRQSDGRVSQTLTVGDGEINEVHEAQENLQYIRFENVQSAVLVELTSGEDSLLLRTVRAGTTTESISIADLKSLTEKTVVAPGVRMESKRVNGAQFKLRSVTINA